MERKVIRPVRGWLDNERSLEIPAGDIIETTPTIVANQIRVHYDAVTEGFGYVWIDQDELESCSVSI